MKILRIGGVNLPTSRFIDVLARADIERLIIVLSLHDSQNIEELYNTVHFFGVEHLLSKLEMMPLVELKICSKIMKKTGKKFALKQLVKLGYASIARQIEKCYREKGFDAIWVGDNDFDGSNDLFVGVMEKFQSRVPIVRSYKETRFIRRWEEYVTLREAHHVIIPSPAYLEFFYDLYGITLEHVSFADVDWRCSKTVEWVKTLKVEKLSEKDHIPHVCILTGRALSSPSEQRSGFRYYYVPIIKELISRNIAVHLHARSILPDQRGHNLYAEIERHSDLFYIERPLNLTAGSFDYAILKRYDAGIMHPIIPKEYSALERFQQINIPNRYYEYLMADVMPLVLVGSGKEMERLVIEEDYGILFTDYDNLATQLFELVKRKEKRQVELQKIKTYKDFADVLVQAILAVS